MTIVILFTNSCPAPAVIVVVVVVVVVSHLHPEFEVHVLAVVPVHEAAVYVSTAPHMEYE